MPKFKLLQINVTANSGSHGKIAEGIGKLALQNGFESKIAYGRWARPSQSELIRIGSWWNFPEHLLETITFGNHGQASRIATQKFIRQIDRYKPDIIHLHNIHGYYINYPILFQYLKKINIPVIWTLHDCWPFTGHCAYFDLVQCNKWQIQCHHCPQKTSYPFSLLSDNSVKNFQRKKYFFTLLEKMTIVPVSHWLTNLLKDSFLSQYSCQTIHNGINPNLFIPGNRNAVRKANGWYNKKILLGVASKWEPRKGLNDFIRLSSILPKNYIIILIGLRKWQTHSLPANILPLSRTESTQQLADYYSAADIFLNLTYEDNFPTVNLEAMSCGTPVITYRTGGSPEAISAKTGAVVTPGNLDELYQTITTLNIQREDCRRHILNHFQEENCFQQYIDLYKSYLNIH